MGAEEDNTALLHAFNASNALFVNVHGNGVVPKPRHPPVFTEPSSDSLNPAAPPGNANI